MSKSFINRSQNQNTSSNHSNELQKKIDPQAQLDWINNQKVDQGFGVFNNDLQVGNDVAQMSGNIALEKKVVSNGTDIAQTKEDEKKQQGIHVVKKGDTYYSLSRKYGVTVDQLREWNGYKEDKIPIGIELIVSPNLSGSRIISSSDRRPLLDPSDPTKLRDDLVFGDKTNSDLVQEGADYWINLYKSDAKLTDQQLFQAFRTMAAELFTSSEMTPVLEEMISLFETNSGGEMGQDITADGKGYAVFTKDKLDETVQNSDEGQRFLNIIQNSLVQQLNQGTHPDKINLSTIGDAQRPMFNDFWTHTFRGGLTIALNDTQAFDIRLDKLIINDNGTYTGSFSVTLYDHFGLDEGDVTPKLFPL